MFYFYLKAFHIVFIVTWFSGMFYLCRLFVYNTEANAKPEPEKSILQHQFNLMIKRLLFGITLPSAILTVVIGLWLLHSFGQLPGWMIIKLICVLLLLLYHTSLHLVYAQQKNKVFKYTSSQLRVWNEVPTVLLVSIVLLVMIRQELNVVYLAVSMAAFMVFMMAAVKIYKAMRGNE
ncbi:MAG: CopD family protein [Bacteroidetes bacterium]|nr:CopD family protein [Bacteroidota bacterium]